MIETMQGPCLPAQRPAHDQPHHHFDALAAGFTQIFDMRNVAQGIAFADKAIEEHIVPFAVDQAGAWTLDLVAHAPCAPDLYVKIFREAFDRALDRLRSEEHTSELKA